MLVVLAAIAVLTIGGRTVADTLAGPASSPTGFPGVVSVTPAAGWEQTAYEDEPGVERLTLAKGAVQLSITGMPSFQGDAVELADTYYQLQRSQRPWLRAGEAHRGSLPSGLSAVAFPYQGWTADNVVVGRVVAVVGPGGQGVVFDAYGPEQDLTRAIANGELKAMIDGAAIP